MTDVDRLRLIPFMYSGSLSEKQQQVLRSILVKTTVTLILTMGSGGMHRSGEIYTSHQKE
jgi:hypothetical protein